MKPNDFELAVINATRRTQRREPVEDMIAELKASWIDEFETARMLAAMSNAAHGEPVMWIVGVDEKAATVKGAPPRELSEWWAKVKSHFDGTPPDMLQNHIFIIDELPVVGLLFDTKLAPYVIKWAKDRPQREIPFRQGNSTYSATREQLLGIVLPLAKAPQLEVMTIALDLVVTPIHSGGSHAVHWIFDADVFLKQRQDQEITLAAHKTRVVVRLEEGVYFDLGSVSFGDRASGGTRNIVTCRGPEIIRVKASLENQQDVGVHFPNDELRVSIEVAIPNCDSDVDRETEVKASRGRGQPEIESGKQIKQWSFAQNGLHARNRKPELSLSKMQQRAIDNQNRRRM
jgi:hypothetical protein